MLGVKGKGWCACVHLPVKMVVTADITTCLDCDVLLCMFTTSETQLSVFVLIFWYCVLCICVECVPCHCCCVVSSV